MMFPTLVAGATVAAAAAGPTIPAKAVALAQHFLSGYGNWAIVVLSVAVAIYHPIGPDLLIILRGLAGGNAFGSAALAAVFTLIGSLVGYYFGRGLGARLLPRLFRSRMAAVEKFRAVFAKYGIWLVALSAFGPVPLTYVCWLAGFSNLRARTFALGVTIGMLPRFFGEAAAVTIWGDHVRQLLGGISAGALPR
ncbi:MAG TPA: VTT domain-containing protein [bacterium]|nr:VTT domain-containing protein [bacterium]